MSVSVQHSRLPEMPWEMMQMLDLCCLPSLCMCVWWCCRYNVEYPNLYATPDNCPNEANRKKFNCVQVCTVPHVVHSSCQKFGEVVPPCLGLLRTASVHKQLNEDCSTLSVPVPCVGFVSPPPPHPPTHTLTPSSSAAAAPWIHALHNYHQRAHQNSLENQPIFLALLTISGLQVSVHGRDMRQRVQCSTLSAPTTQPVRRLCFVTTPGHVCRIGISVFPLSHRNCLGGIILHSPDTASILQVPAASVCAHVVQHRCL